MEANVKPGTRCECRDGDCAGCEVTQEGRDRFGLDDYEFDCNAEAVRVVTVLEPVLMTSATVRLGFWPEGMLRQVPMCAACAEYHEARQGKCPACGHSVALCICEPVEAQQKEPGAEARCDVCNEWKPRDEVRLVTAAQAAGTETWACESCREGGRP